LSGLNRAPPKPPRQHALDLIRTSSPVVHEALASHVCSNISAQFGFFENLKLVQKPGLSKDTNLKNDSPASGIL
jgi:hypothetical protein